MPVEFTPDPQLTDEVGEDRGELDAEQEFPVECGHGGVVFRDWDFLDPDSEVCGVLMVQVDLEGGVWRLMGSGEGPGYSQTWERIGQPASKAGKLRPVN